MDSDSASGQVVVYYGTCGLFAMQRVKVLWADGAMQSNVGHQLLVKQGWQAGQGLGKQNQGQVEPIPIVVKQEQLGVGRIQMEMEQAEETTGRRRQLECEKADSEELQQKYKRNQEREAAKNESVADLKANLHCDLCDKQYSRHADFDNHMSSQDHAHKKRLKTLRQREFGRNVTCQKHKESRTVEKLQRRMNDFADARVKRLSPATQRSPSTLPLPLTPVKAEQPRSTVNSVPRKGDHSPPKKESPAPKAEKSASDSESPASKINLPISKIELPASKVESSPSNVESSSSKVESSSAKVESSPSKVESSPSKVESSPSKVESSPTTIELPASKVELSPSKIDLPPPSKIELPPSKTKTSPTESDTLELCKTEPSDVAPSQIELPPPKAEVAPSDIELPPSEIELFLSELEMAPAAIPPPKSLPITTVFYTDGSSDAPPLPMPSDDAGNSTPDAKTDTQHAAADVKDSPGKSGVVSFTFAKKASMLLLPGAVFAKTGGKKVTVKGKRGHESGSETSPAREGCHSSPSLNCKVKPLLDFVHADVAAKENTVVGGNGDASVDAAVTKKLLEFHSVTSADDTRQLPWPGEMVQHTHVAPSITFCCNPLYFDFTQLRAKSSHAAKDSHANGDVAEETPVEKKKPHKKHRKKSRGHRSRSERNKRKLLLLAENAGKAEDNGSAGDEHKTTGTTLHKAKKHKHRKSKRSKRHRQETVGDGDGVEGEKKDSSGKKETEKDDALVVDGKKPHKAKKKKSHRSKKDKKVNTAADTASSEKGSTKDESNVVKSAPGKEKEKEKKKKSDREKKSCEEESSKESELDETSASADGKKKRKYRKRKHTASCHPDSSDDEDTGKTGKGTKKAAVPVSFKRKGISSTSELSDNAKETKLLEAKLQKNKKQKVNMVMVDTIKSSHVHMGEVKAAKSADCVLPVPHTATHTATGGVGVELAKTLKVPVVTGTIGKFPQVVVKNDDQNCDSKNKPKEVGKSKWDTSSDSELDNAGPVMAKAMAALPLPDTTEVSKDVDHVVSSHSNRSSVRSRKNSGQSQSEKTAKTSVAHHSDRSDSDEKVTKRKGHGKDNHGGSKHSRSRSRSASSKRRSRSYSTDSKYDEGRSRSRSYSSDDYSDDYDRRWSHTRTPSRDRRRSRSHTRTPSRDRRWSRTPSRDRRRSHSHDSRRSRHGHRSYSSYSRSRSRSNSYSRRNRRRKSRSYSGGRHRHHRSYSRSYSRSRSRSSYSRSRSRSHSPVGSHGRHWPYSREHRYNSTTVKSLLPKQKAPTAKRVDMTKKTAADVAKSSTSTDVRKSERASDATSKSTGDEGKASPSKDSSSTTVVDPSKIPTPTADSIPLPPSGKGKTMGRSAAESIPLPDAPADDSASNIFQPIGPNDPLVFKVPLPPPPPPADGTHAKGDASMPPPPPLPDGVAPSSEGKTTEAFMIPPEQVERYKQLRQQAQIHARARAQAQRRLEAGYDNDSDDEEFEEEDPQQQLMLDTMDMQQMEMLPQQLLIPHSPQPMQHIMSLSPGGVPASLAGFMPGAHSLSGLQQAVHMVPQAGAPVMVAAPSAGAGHLMQQMMPSTVMHVMGPGGIPIAVQQMPSQQQLLQQQLVQQQQQQLMHQQLLQQQQQQLMQQPMFIQAGGAGGLIHASQTAVMPQLVPVAQQLPNGQVIVGQQVVMQRVLRPHM